jgi:hypothetical protein
LAAKKCYIESAISIQSTSDHQGKIMLHTPKLQAIQNYCVAIEPLAFARPSEEVDASHVAALVERIRTSGRWLIPIAVEQCSGIIMDGNHRLRAAIALGLEYIPCVPLHYSDPRVRIVDWNTGQPYDIQKIYQALACEQILPYKSTRHLFSPRLPETNISLALLQQKLAAPIQKTNPYPL